MDSLNHFEASFHALSACCTKSIAVLDEMASEASLPIRSEMRVVQEAHGEYIRKAIPLPPWRVMFGNGKGVKAVQALPEFTALIKAIKLAPGVERYLKERVSCAVMGSGPIDPSQFALTLIRSSFRANSSGFFEMKVESAIEEFADFITDDHFQIRFIAPLRRFNAEVIPIKLDEFISITPMTPDETTNLWSWTNLISDSDREPVSFRPPFAIKGTARIRKNFGPTQRASKEKYEEIHEQALRVIHILRLVQDGMVSAPWLNISIVPLGGMDGSGNSRILSPDNEGPGGFHLTTDDTRIVQEIWLAASESDTAPHVLESLRWFGHSKERTNEQDRAVNLMTAAEALFVPDGTQELSFRASLRAARYAETPINTREKIFDHMTAAYKLRSQIVHGTRINKTAVVDGVSIREFSSMTDVIMRTSIIRALRERKLPNWKLLVLNP